MTILIIDTTLERYNGYMNFRDRAIGWDMVMVAGLLLLGLAQDPNRFQHVQHT